MALITRQLTDAAIASARARVYRSTSEAYSAGWQDVLFDTVDFDYDSLWDAATKRFIVVVTGYYAVHVRVAIASGIVDLIAGVLCQGSSDSDHALSMSIQSGTVNKAAGGTALLYLTPGQTIRPRVYAGASATLDPDQTRSYMELLGPF